MGTDGEEVDVTLVALFEVAELLKDKLTDVEDSEVALYAYN